MLDEYRSRASFCPKRMLNIFDDEASQAYRVKSIEHQNIETKILFLGKTLVNFGFKSDFSSTTRSFAHRWTQTFDLSSMQRIDQIEFVERRRNVRKSSTQNGSWTMFSDVRLVDTREIRFVNDSFRETIQTLGTQRHEHILDLDQNHSVRFETQIFVSFSTLFFSFRFSVVSLWLNWPTEVTQEMRTTATYDRSTQVCWSIVDIFDCSVSFSLGIHFEHARHRSDEILGRVEKIVDFQQKSNVFI